MDLSPPKDLSHHLSRSTKARTASNIKQFYKYFSIPGIGQLAGGLPNPSYFPYDTLEAKVALPDRWTPTPNEPISASSSPISSKKHDDKKNKKDSPPSSHVLVPPTSASTNPLQRIDLASALQYGTAQGYPPLYAFVRSFALQYLHPHIPYKGGAEIILTCGSTDGFSKAMQALTNEWSEGRDPVDEREGMLVEEFCYMNAVQTARPRGVNIVPVGMDDEGMRVEGKGGLRDVLENWDSQNGRRPHLMYTVTVGQNPTSGTLSLPRRKEIYALCERYDIIIIEDDPYFYLQYPSSMAPSLLRSPSTSSSKNFPFLDSLIPSYLSIDTSGRVLRLDTFSKTIAPGCRLGWITAQSALVERILRITETSTQQPSGFVQAMVAETILGRDGKGGAAAAPGGREGDSDGWMVQGWVRWLEGLRGEYERRMNRTCDVLEEGRFVVKSGRRRSLNRWVEERLPLSPAHNAHAEDDEDEEWAVVERVQVYDFPRPTGGMFVWMRFDFSSHPLSPSRRTTLSSESVPEPLLSKALWALWTKKPYLVLVSPGSIFAATKEIAERDAWRCFRVCFAAVEGDELEAIAGRLVDGVRRFWAIRNKSVIDGLLEELDPVEDMGSLRGGDGMVDFGGMGVC